MKVRDGLNFVARLADKYVTGLKGPAFALIMKRVVACLFLVSRTIRGNF